MAHMHNVSYCVSITQLSLFEAITQTASLFVSRGGRCPSRCSNKELALMGPCRRNWCIQVGRCILLFMLWGLQVFVRSTMLSSAVCLFLFLRAVNACLCPGACLWPVAGAQDPKVTPSSPFSDLSKPTTPKGSGFRAFFMYLQIVAAVHEKRRQNQQCHCLKKKD